MFTFLPAITFCGFVETQVDARILIQACLLEILPFRACQMTEAGSFGTESGSIYVQDVTIPTQRLPPDEKEWQYVDRDAEFTTKRAGNGSGLWKNEMSVQMDGRLYWIQCFYLPWQIVDGTLPPPSECPAFRGLAEEAVIAVPNFWKPMRSFCAQLKVRSGHRRLSENKFLICCRQVAHGCNTSFERTRFTSSPVGRTEYLTSSSLCFHSYSPAPSTGSQSRNAISFETKSRSN